MAFIRFTAQQLRAFLATLAAALGEDSGSNPDSDSDSGSTDQHTDQSSDDEVPGLTDTDTRSDSSLGDLAGRSGPLLEEELDRELSAALGPRFNRIETEIAANDGFFPSSVAGIISITGYGTPWSRYPSPTQPNEEAGSTSPGGGGSDRHSRNSLGGHPASEASEDWPSDATIWALSDPDDVSVSEWHSDSSSGDESEAAAEGEEGEDEAGPVLGCKRPYEGNSESEEPPRKRRMR